MSMPGMNEESIFIEIRETPSNQFVCKLSLNGYPSGLDSVGCSIKESVMGLLYTMSTYKFETIRDVEDFIFKSKNGVVDERGIE